MCSVRRLSASNAPPPCRLECAAASPPHLTRRGALTHSIARLACASAASTEPTAASSPPPAALDVFLALEVGKTLYSNLDFGAILAQQHNQCGAKAVSQQMVRRPRHAAAANAAASRLIGFACVSFCLCVVQATEQFSPWLAAAHFSNHTTRHIELLNWGRYRRDRPRIERQTRLQHHLSQFAHMRTCAQLMQEREVAARAHYDVVLKMRDNTVAVS